jgi:hypothetical protein
VLPHRFRSSALRACGAGRLAPIAPGASRAAPSLAVVTVTAPITEFGIGSCPQFVVMAAVAPSSLGVAVNTCGRRAPRAGFPHCTRRCTGPGGGRRPRRRVSAGARCGVVRHPDRVLLHDPVAAPPD